MTNRFVILILTLFLGATPFSVFGQESVIQLINPSFEDYPRAERVPHGWRDCGFPGESAPDTHPSGAFDVIKYPSDGNTYLGMVVRDNDTWERVSQHLSTPIQAGTCYSFSLNLSRSELYVSASRETGTRANYVQPIKLVIWGGDGHCEKRERLAESPLVANTSWKPYAFKFEPKLTHTHITLEAFYKTPVLFPYNGNILIDKASDIVPMPCDETPVIAKIPEVEFTTPQDAPVITKRRQFTLKADIRNIDENLAITFKINGKQTKNFTFNGQTGQVTAKATNLKKGNNRIIIQATNKAGSSEDSAIIIYEPEEAIAYQEPPKQPQSYSTPVQPKIIPSNRPKKRAQIEGFSRAEITKGQIIKISSLSFKMNDSTITQSAATSLDKIYDFLLENEEIVIEIGGHTSGLCDDFYCNQLSTARAKAVAAYLQQKGINQKQLSYKGYGKTKPISSNNTTGGRRKNQRVEIKILSTDGVIE
ncbi:MAG: OmpA family protein [Saprospiraceae bacterium]